MKLKIAISPVLVGQKYPSGDQIQGLDTSYPVDPIESDVSDCINSSFSGKFKCVFGFFAFCGSKRSIHMKIIVGTLK